MSESPKQGISGRLSALLLCGIISAAVVGYFVGIRDGVPRDEIAGLSEPFDLTKLAEESSSTITNGDTAVVPAVTYANMRRGESGPTSQWTSSLERIPQPDFDLMAEIKPSPDDKARSTATRGSRRAFNGAPPIIPHAVERTDDAACYACHGNGMRIGDRLANRMCHGFLANCTQCHAEPPPTPFAEVDAGVQNSFVGLPAPLQGERAFPGAPPTIPHSTWMRNDCLSCHGSEAGWAGLESTHPWRVNCEQCHAPSAALEQGVVWSSIPFLPPIDVKQP